MTSLLWEANDWQRDPVDFSAIDRQMNGLYQLFGREEVGRLAEKIDRAERLRVLNSTNPAHVHVPETQLLIDGKLVPNVPAALLAGLQRLEPRTDADPSASASMQSVLNRPHGPRSLSELLPIAARAGSSSPTLLSLTPNNYVSAQLVWYGFLTVATIGVGAVAYRKLRLNVVVAAGTRVTKRLAGGARDATILAKIKYLELTDLPNALAAVASRAVTSSLADEALAADLDRVQATEAEIVRLQQPVEASGESTLTQRAKRAAEETAKRMKVEQLKRRKKSLLIEVGRQVVASPKWKRREELQPEVRRVNEIKTRIESLKQFR